MRSTIRTTAALAGSAGVLLALTAGPASAARPRLDLPFYNDTVNITNATGSGAVQTAANRWENGTGVDLRWVGFDLYAVAITFDVDHDHGTSTDGGTAIVERTSEDGRTGFVASCVAWIKPGLTGAPLAKAVTRTVGECLGWTTPPTGRLRKGVMNPLNGVSAPTRADLDHLRRMFQLNPVEPS